MVERDEDSESHTVAYISLKRNIFSMTQSEIYLSRDFFSYYNFFKEIRYMNELQWISTELTVKIYKILIIIFLLIDEIVFICRKATYFSAMILFTS